MYEVLETGGHERLTKEIFQKIKDEVPTTDDKVKQSPTNDGIYDILLSGSAAGSAEATEGSKKSSTYPLKYSTHGGILSIGDGDTNFGGVSLGWAGSPNVTVERTNQTTGAKNWVEMGLDDIKFNSNSSGTPDTWDGKNTSLKAALAEAAGSGGGAGGSSVYSEKVLWEDANGYTSNTNASVTLTDNLLNYDAIVIEVSRESDYNFRNQEFVLVSMIDKTGIKWFPFDMIGSSTDCIATCRYIDETHLILGHWTYIKPVKYYKIVGLKFGTLSPIIYSEEEREVGVWIDNKPLYAKTINHDTAMTNRAWTQLINDSNIDIKLYDGCIYLDGYPYTYINYHRGATANEYSCGAIFNNGHGFQVYPSIDGATITCKVTLYYTKTTDTAGSGSYNTLGVPTVHYTTDEQVIGTYLGKPLYQKTFDWSSSPVHIPSTWLATTIDSSNIERVIDCKGHHADGTFYTTDADPTGNNHTKLKMRNNGGGGTYSYVTLQYTKIND